MGEHTVSSDDESLDETAYLLSNPANAERLRASIARLENDQSTRHELVECYTNFGRPTK